MDVQWRESAQDLARDVTRRPEASMVVEGTDFRLTASSLSRWEPLRKRNWAVLNARSRRTWTSKGVCSYCRAAFYVSGDWTRNGGGRTSWVEVPDRSLRAASVRK